jgi:hypothetical protein
MSLEALREKAKLECSADSLSRKLNGKQALYAEEIEALAGVFEREVRIGRRRKAA